MPPSASTIRQSLDPVLPARPPDGRCPRLRPLTARTAVRIVAARRGRICTLIPPAAILPVCLRCCHRITVRPASDRPLAVHLAALLLHARSSADDSVPEHANTLLGLHLRHPSATITTAGCRSAHRRDATVKSLLPCLPGCQVCSSAGGRFRESHSSDGQSVLRLSP